MYPCRANFLTLLSGGANEFLRKARHTSTCYKWPTMAPNQLKEKWVEQK